MKLWYNLKINWKKSKLTFFGRLLIQLTPRVYLVALKLRKVAQTLESPLTNDEHIALYSRNFHTPHIVSADSGTWKNYPDLAWSVLDCGMLIQEFAFIFNILLFDEQKLRTWKQTKNPKNECQLHLEESTFRSSINKINQIHLQWKPLKKCEIRTNSEIFKFWLNSKWINKKKDLWLDGQMSFWSLLEIILNISILGNINLKKNKQLEWLEIERDKINPE